MCRTLKRARLVRCRTQNMQENRPGKIDSRRCLKQINRSTGIIRTKTWEVSAEIIPERRLNSTLRRRRESSESAGTYKGEVAAMDQYKTNKFEETSSGDPITIEVQ